MCEISASLNAALLFYCLSSQLLESIPAFRLLYNEWLYDLCRQDLPLREYEYVFELIQLLL